MSHSKLRRAYESAHYGEDENSDRKQRKAQWIARFRKQRAIHLRNKFKISIEEYDFLFSSQGGVCPICGDALLNGEKGLWPHVDHDHQSGRIRGILCSACNKGIGFLKDDPIIVYSAAKYLVASSQGNVGGRR